MLKPACVSCFTPEAKTRHFSIDKVISVAFFIMARPTVPKTGVQLLRAKYLTSGGPRSERQSSVELSVRVLALLLSSRDCVGCFIPEESLRYLLLPLSEAN
jgi:hypothetical protein